MLSYYEDLRNKHSETELALAEIEKAKAALETALSIVDKIGMADKDNIKVKIFGRNIFNTIVCLKQFLG